MSVNSESINYQLYVHDLNYKEKSRFCDYWDQMEGYFEGTKHYPANMSKKLPKVIVNFCKFLVLNKASKIIGTPYTVVFQTAGGDDSTLKLQHFYKFILLTMGDDRFNYEAVENALIFGQEITYITYDEDYTTFKAFKKGGFKEIHIDPRHFAVANPKEPDIQKQEWVMYWSDENVQSVRNMCLKMKGESKEEFEARKNRIIPDDLLNNDDAKIDREDVSYGLCTIYTRFFRINGEVYFQVSTQTVDLFEPKPLSPQSISKKIDFEVEENLDKDNVGMKVADYKVKDNAVIDTQVSNPKDMSEEEYQNELWKFSMYPFVVYRAKNRFNNFYGISELQDVIGAQQSINALISYMTFDIKTNASGKYVVKKDTLKGQKINEEAGQIITDYSTINGYGIKRLEGQTMATNIMGYVGNIFDLERSVTGTSEIFTGDMSQDLSGTAISLLQQQGNTVIEQQQKNFNNDYCVEKAKVIYQFITHYVDEYTYLYERDNADYDEEVMYRKKLMDYDQQANPNEFAQLLTNQEALNQKYPPINRVEQETFSTRELKHKVLYVQPKSGRGIKYSEIIQADFLQKLLLNGGIEKYDSQHLQLMLEILPLVDETTKANLNVQIEKMKNSEIAQLQEQISGLQGQLQEAGVINQKYQQVLEYLKTYNKELSKQFSQQLAAAKLEVQNRDDVLRGVSLPQTNTPQTPNQKPTSTEDIAKAM